MAYYSCTVGVITKTLTLISHSIFEYLPIIATFIIQAITYESWSLLRLYFKLSCLYYLDKPTLSLFRQSVNIVPCSAMEYYATSEIWISIKNKFHGILAALITLEHPKEVGILLIRTHAQFSTYPLSINFHLRMMLFLL